MPSKQDSFTDALGYTVLVGDRVVYNLSGSLAIGVVESITTSPSGYGMYRQDRYTVTVQYVNGKFPKYKRFTHRSKVKNLDSIMRVDAIA